MSGDAQLFRDDANRLLADAEWCRKMADLTDLQDALERGQRVKPKHLRRALEKVEEAAEHCSAMRITPNHLDTAETTLSAARQSLTKLETTNGRT